MRRPLCPVLLLWAAVIWLITAVHPPVYSKAEYTDGDTVVLEGIVDNTDCWINEAGEEIRVLYLKQASDAADSKSTEPGNQRKDTSDQSASASKEAVHLSGPDINNQSNQTEITDNLICYLDQESTLPRIGSHVRCIGRWSLFRQASNPGEFDSASYYRARGYTARLKNAAIVGMSREYSVYRDFLYRLRRNSQDVLYELLPPKDASILAAMLLGEKKGMDSEVRQLYQDAGISHILAISGLHISLIGMGIFRLLKRLGLPFGLSAAVSVLLLISYVVMTGISASSLRALIMFLLCIWAQSAGRTVDYPTAMCVAAVLILLTEPAYIYDSGFRLSFSASAGAVLVIPAFQEMLIPPRRCAGGPGQSIRQKRKARLADAAVSSFCISMFSLPVVLCSFYQWNWVSVGVNILVIPLMGIVMGAGIGMITLGNISLFATGITATLPARVPAGIAQLIFMVYEKLCRFASECRFGKLHTGMPALWQLILFYFGFLLLLLIRKRIRRRTGIITVTLLSLLFLIRLPQGTTLTMLDVGQGDSIYLETETGNRYLTDAGSTSLPDTGTWQVIPFLKYKGVDRLEGIFVSHWDEDHINGLEAVCTYTWKEGIPVKAMYLPETDLQDDALTGLLDMARRYEIPVIFLKSGDVIRDGNASFTCLHPGRGEAVTDRNASSAVYLFRTGGQADEEGFSVLLTGDIEKEGESWILEHVSGLPDRCSVLKTAHHGSDTSTSQAWTQQISPRIALISCGRKNRYGHPSQTVIKRLESVGCRVFITARSGAVTVRYRKNRISVDTFLTDG